ncbi:MAG: hypothetical protein DRP64_03275 [Verrucomicrobia bacterium]|nr:MAG: hypothetical protein DRP64_03275 [Verrucomicrobiota bacterium]
MTYPIKPNLTKKIGITALLMLPIGLKAFPAANSQTNQVDGIDGAVVGTVAVQRDPFWPVGYTPERLDGKGSGEQGKALESSGKIDWNKAMKQVAIQGVSSRAGNEFFAVVNGQIKSTGETVSVQVGGVSYTWMIDGISPPSSVKLRRVSAR